MIREIPLFQKNFYARGIEQLLFATFLVSASSMADSQELAVWRDGGTAHLILDDLNGKRINLADLRGKTVLVNFWATWCTPCVEEMPSLQQLRTKLGEERLTVLAVNVGDSKKRIDSFLKKVPLDLPILLDPHSETSKEWKVRGLPTTFIVGPDGRIRYYQVGDLDWAKDSVVNRIRNIE
jgi:thiol-disulfide isomerase/thioredoxin